VAARLSGVRVIEMIDALIAGIRNVSNDPVAVNLVKLLEEWKSDNFTVTELERSIEKYIGNTWLASEQEHKDIYLLWSKFKVKEISDIKGMTMNERLFTFGLFERFEKISSETGKHDIYKKLHAKP
jgi:hypothetical protein